MLEFMTFSSEEPVDRLWQEYSLVFKDLDDATLARWMAQTLGQLQGRAWRLSHPLLGAYRLAAQLAHQRQIWLKRLASIPAAYSTASCCRAPLLPLLTRDVAEVGLLCQHCGETAVPVEEIPFELRRDLKTWAAEYNPLHTVAHWEPRQQQSVENYQTALDNAADAVALLLAQAGRSLAPHLLEHFPAAVWEDQDECLEVRPEDIQFDGADSN